jgi:hypothetical protein
MKIHVKAELEEKNILKIYNYLLSMLEIISSPKNTHRFIALFQKNIYYFGHPNIHTYIDGVSPAIKTKYIQMCLKDKYKTEQIYHLVPSEYLFENYILWGNSRNIDVNITHLNGLLCKKYKGIDYFY